MNPTAVAIAAAYCGVVLLAVIAAVIVWRSTHSFERNRRDTVDTSRLAHAEKGWFIFSIAGLAALLLATLAFIPYGDNAAASGQQPVRVQAQQFAWIVSPSTIKAGVPARFEVRSRDVNHGFAVYNSDNVLLFQIQALPDHTSHIVYTFKVPGRYQVVCLEFCGVGHHRMLGSFQVAP